MPIRRRKPASGHDILLRIVESAEGACACGTKEAELSWHHPTCLWRVLSEAAFEIERLRTQLEAVEAKPAPVRKKAPDRRQTSLMLPVKGGKEAEKVEKPAKTNRRTKAGL
jgi:hypothetical protein